VTTRLVTNYERRWAAGTEIWLGEYAFLLRQQVEEHTATDQSWVWREADASPVATPASGVRVRLRQVVLRRLSRHGAQLRDGLGAQADLLSTMDGAYGLPHLVGRHDDGGRTTLVTTLVTAPAWRDGYGPGRRPLDRLTAAAALAAATALCGALGDLHRLGFAHRSLSPDTVVLLDRYRLGTPRDLGLAGFRATPGEGTDGYRAPEQVEPAEPRMGVTGRRPGPATDIYQVAALIYHTLTGRRAGPAPNPPIRAAIPSFPTSVDTVITTALSTDPRRRPSSIDAVAEALTLARTTLVAA
jgi:serine/threonine protein kinase